MEPFAMHVFVCTGGGTCPHQRSVAVHAFLKEAVARARLKSRVRVSQAGCLDQCGHGPLVVIYPECGLPDSAFRPRASWRLTPVAAFR